MTSGPYSLPEVKPDGHRRYALEMALELAKVAKGEAEVPSVDDLIGDARKINSYILDKQEPAGPDAMMASVNSVVMPQQELYALGHPNAPLAFVPNRDNAEWLAGIINKHFSMED